MPTLVEADYVAAALSGSIPQGCYSAPSLTLQINYTETTATKLSITTMNSSIDLALPTEADNHALLLPDLVFSIVEHLDFHSLLRCQRVCKTWRSVILGSREARQTLFLESDTAPFDAFKAAEQHDIVARNPPAWKLPAHRILLRPEFRAMFNPWVFTHGCEPIYPFPEDGMVSYWDREPAWWGFTDRVSSGRLEYSFIPAELARFASSPDSSSNSMFLTQPPVKKVIVAIQGGYMTEEEVELENDEGVRIGDVLSFIRKTKAVDVMSKRTGEVDFTTIDVEFNERPTSGGFMQMQQLEEDGFGGVSVRVF
jgi:hypothetical protein